MKKKLVALRIPEELHWKWKLLAVEEKTTMSEIVERLIEAYLKRKGVK